VRWSALRVAPKMRAAPFPHPAHRTDATSVVTVSPLPPALASVSALKRDAGAADASRADATAPFVEIARRPMPGGDFRAAEMELLPYDDGAFDAVTGFNAFQYAASPLNALREARRVVKADGIIVIAVWGLLESWSWCVCAFGRSQAQDASGRSRTDAGRYRGCRVSRGLSGYRDRTRGHAVCGAGRASNSRLKFRKRARSRRCCDRELRTETAGYRLNNTLRYLVHRFPDTDPILAMRQDSVFRHAM
jgi:SAM-dependent methyltransferase